MRKFIRHPSSIPVRIQKVKTPDVDSTTLVNVSHGGLSLHFPEYIENGTRVELLIDTIDPRISIKGIVVWSHKNENGYDLGIRFLEQDDVFQMRMVEQICHIEDYREEIQREQGRNLTSEEAAAEWIEKFAEHFPTINGKSV